MIPVLPNSLVFPENPDIQILFLIGNLLCKSFLKLNTHTYTIVSQINCIFSVDLTSSKQSNEVKDFQSPKCGHGPQMLARKGIWELTVRTACLNLMDQSSEKGCRVRNRTQISRRHVKKTLKIDLVSGSNGVSLNYSQSKGDHECKMRILNCFQSTTGNR